MKKVTHFCQWLNLALNDLMKKEMLKKPFIMRSFARFFFCSLLLAMLLPTWGFTQNLTLTSSPVAASNIAQATTNNIVYIVKMDVTSSPVTVNSMQFTLTGTHDNNDLTTISILFNATAPSLTGAQILHYNESALFAAPHVYNIVGFNNSGPITILAGASGYFIIAVNTAAAATSGHTVKTDGAVNPVSFGYTTAPTITNNQTDAAGTQTMIAAGITLTTSTVPASNIAQGSNNNIVYIVKMDVTSFPVTINSIQFTLTGTHDANDLTTISILFNATAPSLTGAQILHYNESALFAAPHVYNIVGFNNSGPKTIAAGASGYFIITVNVDAAATGGNTVKINGLADPVTFGYTTAPTITNNQTDIAGTQTMMASGVTLTTSAIAAANIAQGSTNNIVYAVRMDVTSLPVTVNSIQFKLTGTHDVDDLTTISILFNATAPSLTGAQILHYNESALFAAPHVYNIVGFNNSGPKTIAAGASGYFIIAINVDAASTSGNTVKVNGLADPVIFGYATSPTVSNNQTDAAGTQTISATLPLTLLSFTGKAMNEQEVLLQWITAGEFNTKDFEVEWNDDGQHFSKIAVLPAAGNSSQNLHYSYLHKLPFDGNNYYRLKMFDIDGRFTYSPVIKIKIAITKDKIVVFPNPDNDLLQLQVQAVRNEAISFHLYSADGKAIASKLFTVTKGNNRLSWNLPQLAPGNYFISSGNDHFETIKIFKN
jgi:hypothetical protein